MKVALWMPQGHDIPGGHRVQFTKTAAALRAEGIDVVELTGELGDERVDLVHGFGLHSRHVQDARGRGLPVVISPIYWGLSYRAKRGDRAHSGREFLGRVRRAARFTTASMGGRESLVRVALDDAAVELDRIAAWSAADMLLVNAAGEGEEIVTDLGVQTEIRFAPNAVDDVVFLPRRDVVRRPRSVLCVGRVEPHKNQLGLINALADSEVELVVAGPPHPHHPDYYEQCRRAASGRVQLIGPVEHDELPTLYQSFTTHVLPTWFETTGLVSLEAALSGCTIVTTSRGHAAEYLGSDAWYCDPAEPASIRSAVLQAVEAAPSAELRHRVLSNYTWRNTALATVGAYEAVLSRRTQHPLSDS